MATGVVGSLTHCTGYRAAAVAHQRDVPPSESTLNRMNPCHQMSRMGQLGQSHKTTLSS
jgi:hypothetical protein